MSEPNELEYAWSIAEARNERICQLLEESLALRARVAQLEGALKRADLLIMDGFPDGAHVEIRAAIEDTPQ
jgi:hypothetical protein